jgi:hypothetical protein
MQSLQAVLYAYSNGLFKYLYSLTVSNSKEQNCADYISVLQWKYVPSNWHSLDTYTLKNVPTCTGTKDSLLNYGLLYMNNVAKWIVIA